MAAAVHDVADVQGDERAGAAEDEHARGECDDDEEEGPVVEDEVRGLPHVGDDAGQA